MVNIRTSSFKFFVKINICHADLNAALRKIGRKFPDGLAALLDKFSFHAGVKGSKSILVLQFPQPIYVFLLLDSCGLFDTSSNVRLDYAVQWPLDLVFTREDVNRSENLQNDNFTVSHITPLSSLTTSYNTIFKFLLRLRRIHTRIHHCWFLVNERNINRRNVKRLDSKALREFVRVRNLMLHFLDNLWSYVQMDVIDAAFTLLLCNLGEEEELEEEEMDDEQEEVEEGKRYLTVQNDGIHSPLTATILSSSPKPRPRNFESIRTLHTDFLESLKLGLFLDDVGGAQVGDRVNQALGLCDDFCMIVERTFDEVASFSNLPLALKRDDPIEIGKVSNFVNIPRLYLF